MNLLFLNGLSTTWELHELLGETGCKFLIPRFSAISKSLPQPLQALTVHCLRTFQQLKRISWDKEDLEFIFELKRLNHDNLTNFLGISYNEGDNFYLLHNLVERGTLEDYINDLDFQLDNTFRSAFLRDILKGIQYLHKSQVDTGRCGGRLSKAIEFRWATTGCSASRMS